MCSCEHDATQLVLTHKLHTENTPTYLLRTYAVCFHTLLVHQAICQLPNLTLLKSLTPALEALQLNPERPHPGCDLAHLSLKAGMTGLDVAVLVPQHLAPIAHFTALQQLNLR